MREVFNRFSKGRATLHVRDIERVAHKGLGVYLDKEELAAIEAAVAKHSQQVTRRICWHLGVFCSVLPRALSCVTCSLFHPLRSAIGVDLM
jgi:hypothetical protein